MDHLFDHRQRTLEKKDGNALNEVRMLCNSLMTDGATLAADTTIKLNPATSTLKLRVGDEIRLDEEDFRLLAEAFFAEIEKKYPPKPETSVRF